MMQIGAGSFFGLFDEREQSEQDTQDGQRNGCPAECRAAHQAVPLASGSVSEGLDLLPEPANFRV